MRHYRNASKQYRKHLDRCLTAQKYSLVLCPREPPVRVRAALQVDFLRYEERSVDRPVVRLDGHDSVLVNGYDVDEFLRQLLRPWRTEAC